MARQYLKIAYKEGTTKTYTFHNDGDPVEAGDVVKLPDRRDPDSWVRGYVHEETDEPVFETKGILGVVEDVA